MIVFNYLDKVNSWIHISITIRLIEKVQHVPIHNIRQLNQILSGIIIWPCKFIIYSHIYYSAKKSFDWFISAFLTPVVQTISHTRLIFLLLDVLIRFHHDSSHVLYFRQPVPFFLIALLAFMFRLIRKAAFLIKSMF